MTGLVQIIEQQQQRESQRQVEAQLLTTQLAKLRSLRNDELRLRAKVAFLEKQAAAQGPLQRKADLVVTLQVEQSELQQLRNELEAQQQQLTASEVLPADAGLHLEAERLDERISDLKSRRQQARLHQGNVHYLEEKLARLGDEASLDLVNELTLCQEELKQVASQLAALHSRLQIEWQLSPADIPNLDEMSERQIKDFALAVVAKREVDSQAVVLRHMSEAIGRFDGTVTALLDDLRVSSYPTGSVRSPVTKDGVEVNLVRSDGPLMKGVDLVVPPPTWESRENVVWSVREPGSYRGVDVELTFDAVGLPAKFQCRRYQSDPKPEQSVSCLVDRDSLKAGLIRVHQTSKAWWEFWRSSPTLPNSWR
jgi:hypothetical protein